MANVLLLEPDRLLASLYARGLELFGHRVRACRTGQEAIELLEDFAAKIIVMELQLVGHDGLEFLHELRSYPEWQGLPVVVNTNLAPSVLRPLRAVLQRDAGVSDCLYKPRASLEHLQRVIRATLTETKELS